MIFQSLPKPKHLLNIFSVISPLHTEDFNIDEKSFIFSFQVENIVNCLALLERIGVTLDGITAKDVREGNLKTTLGLFFALSKYKQQQKQRQATQSIVLTPERQQQKRQHLVPPSEDMKQSKWVF